MTRVKKKLLLDKKKFRDGIDIGSDAWGKLVSINANRRLFCMCHHLQIWHKDREGFCGGVKTGLKDSLSDLCECLKFLPGDNLAYLEWKYDRSIR